MHRFLKWQLVNMIPCLNNNITHIISRHVLWPIFPFTLIVEFLWRDWGWSASDEISIEIHPSLSRLVEYFHPSVINETYVRDVQQSLPLPRVIVGKTVLQRIRLRTARILHILLQYLYNFANTIAGWHRPDDYPVVAFGVGGRLRLRVELHAFMVTLADMNTVILGKGVWAPRSCVCVDNWASL